MQIFELLLWLLNHCIVIELVSSKSCTYRKITTEPQQQGNETGLAGLTVTSNGDDLRRHLPALPQYINLIKMHRYLCCFLNSCSYL